ncbi:MAG: hypothetical protein ACK4ND_01140 [Cytophagaceae bacterium]
MKKNFLILPFLLLLIFSACKKKKEEEPNPSNSAESKQVMQQSAGKLHEDIVELVKSKGSKAVGSLSDKLADDQSPFENGRISLKKRQEAKLYYKNKAKTLRKTFIAKSVQPSNARTNFDFAGNAGTYTWNHSTESWETESGTPGNKIVIIFPADKDNPSVNNATFTLHEYTEVVIQGDSLPTKILADVYIDGVKYVNLDFSAQYKSNGEVSKINYTLLLKPFTNIFSYEDEGTSIKINASLLKEGTIDIFSWNTVMEFDNVNKDAMVKVSGSVSYRELKLSGEINAKELSESDVDANAAELNQHVKLAFYKNPSNSKIGDIYFVDKADGDVDAMIKFSDGTSESIESYFKESMDELEKFFTENNQNARRR